MISLKSSEQLEVSFFPMLSWRKLSREQRQQILDQLSLLLLSNLAEEREQHQSTKEDQLCQVK